MLPTALGGAAGEGHMKASPEDFQVTEELGFVPDAGGEHLWLNIEKRGWNTEDVALWLAKVAGIHRLAVGYSGLKDKQAVTRQWFSLQLPGKPDPDIDWPDGLRCLSASRHGRKLNRGTHRFNTFKLRLTQLRVDHDLLEERLAAVVMRGVPNYVGMQRMGRAGRNLENAITWLAGTGDAPRKRQLRSLWLSAMRSHLFNLVLAQRVKVGVWDRLLEGDILQPEGSRGLFRAEDEPHAAERLAARQIHPTGPLPGKGGLVASAAAGNLEASVLTSFESQLAGLEREGVEAARRATRLLVHDLQWQHGRDQLELSFRLQAGAFATTVLSELVTSAHLETGSGTGKEGERSA
jgi:tRNA pseudouridine13 synthase